MTHGLEFFIEILAMVIGWVASYYGLYLMGVLARPIRRPVWKYITGHILFVAGAVTASLIGVSILSDN